MKRRILAGLLAFSLLAGMTPGFAFADAQGKQLDCPLTVHQHTPDCYDAQGMLICGEADYVLHTHNAACYDADGALVCRLKQVEAHAHTDACYEEQRALVCDMKEGEGHAHAEGCYMHEGELTCDMQESAGHQHSAQCYETQRILTCEKTQIAPHTHVDACYDETGALTCGLLQVERHVHGEACLQPVVRDAAVPAAEKAVTPEPIPTTGDISDLPGLDIYPAMDQENGRWVVYNTGNESTAKVKATITLPEGAVATENCHPFIRKVNRGEAYYPTDATLDAAVGKRNDVQCYMIHWVKLDETAGTYDLTTDMEVGNGNNATIQLEYLKSDARLGGAAGERKLRVYSSKSADGSNLVEISDSVQDVDLDTDNYKGFTFNVTERCPYIFVSKKLEKGYVEKLAIEYIVDGSGPFDRTDIAGNDSGDSNKIIRSYDTIRQGAGTDAGRYDHVEKDTDSRHCGAKMQVIGLTRANSHITLQVTDHLWWRETSEKGSR